MIVSTGILLIIGFTYGNPMRFVHVLVYLGPPGILIGWLVLQRKQHPLLMAFWATIILVSWLALVGLTRMLGFW